MPCFREQGSGDGEWELAVTGNGALAVTGNGALAVTGNRRLGPCSLPAPRPADADTHTDARARAPWLRPADGTCSHPAYARAHLCRALGAFRSAARRGGSEAEACVPAGLDRLHGLGAGAE